MPCGLCAAVPVFKPGQTPDKVQNEQKTLVRPSELPIYKFEPIDTPKAVQCQTKPNILEENFGVVRKSVQEFLHQFSSYTSVISNTIETGKAHSQSINLLFADSCASCATAVYTQVLIQRRSYVVSPRFAFGRLRDEEHIPHVCSACGQTPWNLDCSCLFTPLRYLLRFGCAPHRLSSVYRTDYLWQLPVTSVQTARRALCASPRGYDTPSTPLETNIVRVAETGPFRLQKRVRFARRNGSVSQDETDSELCDAMCSIDLNHLHTTHTTHTTHTDTHTHIREICPIMYCAHVTLKEQKIEANAKRLVLIEREREIIINESEELYELFSTLRKIGTSGIRLVRRSERIIINFRAYRLARDSSTPQEPKPKSPPPDEVFQRVIHYLGVPALAKYIAELEKEVTRAQAAYSQEREKRLHAQQSLAHTQRALQETLQQLNDLRGKKERERLAERESTNSCEEDPGEEVAPSIPQILRHRGTDPYCRLTPQHQEEKAPCDSLPHGTF
ncbi:unnamed protein product [Trichogramma brassicae]|uniref:Uncharacterized protein n=1 Tax=Trichogramma brassicae TaxID=86971 RepID=A0A6H5J956_9HYME|nr:unnamed protein product [Trichogramma brassicae]